MVQSVRPPGDGIDYKEHYNELLHIEVLGVETGINTVHGPTDAVRANVTPLDGPTAGTTIADTLIFPKVLQSQLKGSVGQSVIGRLGQGQAKPGQSAPWLLNPATDAEVAAGVQFEASRTVAAPPPAFQPPVAPTGAWTPPTAPAAPVGFQPPRV